MTYYRTSDLSLTAALTAGGFVVLEIETLNPKRSVFIFANSPTLQGVVSQYWNRQLRIEPQAYFNELKTLKARIYRR
jgi:uncharacterized protein DUF5659